jgi:type IX secretion system PorP/SprF family membrane protein
MKKFFLGLMAISGIYSALSAQQDPQFTMFYFNKMLYNPAYAGAKDAICGTFLGRTQWTGLQGAPSTFMFTGDMPINLPGNNNNNQLGIGLTAYGDYIGFQQDQGMKVALAYRRKNLGPGHLAVGVDVGFTNKNFTNPAGSWIYPNVPELLPNMNTPSAFALDLNAGVYYHGQKFYAGVSVLHLTASNFNAMNMKQARHMYITGGYTLGIGGTGSPWRLNPNVLIRTDFATANFDVNLNALYDFNGKHGMFFGATYRYIDAVGINVGYNGTYGPVGVLLAYNYDINTSQLRSFNGGSHEIILRVCFRKKPTICIPCQGNWLWCKKYVTRFGASKP